MWKEMIFKQTVYYQQGKAIRTKGIVHYHIHHCVALTAKSIHLKIRLLLPYSSIEPQGEPICHVAFQIWAVGTGKGSTTWAWGGELHQPFRTVACLKKVSLFQHPLLAVGKTSTVSACFCSSASLHSTLDQVVSCNTRRNQSRFRRWYWVIVWGTANTAYDFEFRREAAVKAGAEKNCPNWVPRRVHFVPTSKGGWSLNSTQYMNDSWRPDI